MENLHFSSPEAAAASLADNFVDQTRSVIREKGRCIWALPGGSSIFKFYDALLPYREEMRGFADRLTVTWVDERVVPHSHKCSNYGNAYNGFWKFIHDIHLVPVPYHPDVQQSVKAFRLLLERNEISKGSIDMMLLGMGVDGHIASLFPRHPVLNEMNEVVSAVSDPLHDFPRVTMTYPMINVSGSVSLFLYGDEKCETFRRAIHSGSVDKYPVLGIEKHKLTVYSDQELTI